MSPLSRPRSRGKAPNRVRCIHDTNVVKSSGRVTVGAWPAGFVLLTVSAYVAVVSSLLLTDSAAAGWVVVAGAAVSLALLLGVVLRIALTAGWPGRGNLRGEGTRLTLGLGSFLGFATLLLLLDVSITSGSAEDLMARVGFIGWLVVPPLVGYAVNRWWAPLLSLVFLVPAAIGDYLVEVGWVTDAEVSGTLGILFTLPFLMLLTSVGLLIRRWRDRP